MNGWASNAHCPDCGGLLNGKPDSYYVARMDRFLKRNKNNCRAGYQAAESGYLTDADESDDTAS